MKLKFWPLLALLVVALVGLLFLRLSPVKLTEQNIIAQLQIWQTASSVVFFQFISDYGKYVNIGIPAVFLVVGLVTKKKLFIRNALIILLGMGLSGIIAQTIKRTVKEPRPYEVDTRITQWSVGGSNSFPSGHTAEVTVATLGFALILFRTPLSVILSIVWALVMMLSRIVLGVHNFTDIAGGIVTGCIGLLVIYQVFERFWKINELEIASS
ncbi:MAG TPA: phosphatase PAP2 family protein [Cyclobacteriaceae bacterium]|nr:phosphatase PAP2 family protein [Cyclobacteriaceae bacterium]